MKQLTFLILIIVIFSKFTTPGPGIYFKSVIGKGQMPNLANDKTGSLHLVYGTGDSIMYSYSVNGGKTFSSPALVSRLHGLAAAFSRGPQIAATANGLVITACNDKGNIYSYIKTSGKWQHGGEVNDVKDFAKENLMALAADGPLSFAVWLDVRDGHNEIYGSRSADGGKSWSKNILVYRSPDTTVCECCKPSVAIKGNNVYVMFRNWLKGNRDLFLTQSLNGGSSFGPAEQLGKGHWQLNGCPMDGGAVVINGNDQPQTVWNRKGTIFACEPGQEEKQVGSGKNCMLASVNNKNVYGWLENKEVVLLKPDGSKLNLGKGAFPVIRAIDDNHILCAWQNNQHIYTAVVPI